MGASGGPTRPQLPLPVDAVLPELVQALSRATGLVLRAETGAGKTTRVPPALLDAGFGPVLMLEPRRLAARAAARRIAQERGVRLGGEVGYHVRFERKAGPDTRILVVTEGLLVRMLQSDPFLEGFGTVVLDEVHERHLHTDLALAMLRRVQREVREDLRLVVMSATVDPGPFGAFLGDVPLLDCAGRSFPVALRWQPSPDPRPLVRQVVDGVGVALEESAGDVLVFLPGLREIRRAQSALSGLRGVSVLPLYGNLPAREQDAVLQPGGRRKVVLATNVAESSVTLPGVSAVVDSGWVKLLRHDPVTGLDRLTQERVSLASAQQRAGRAGRTGPGLCLRLWTRAEEQRMAAHTVPELRRVDLARTVLELRCWGETELERFPWFEAPEPAALALAERRLSLLGAVDAGKLTALGRRMNRLPLSPRLARLALAAAELGWPRLGALAAAVLSERDVLFGVRPRHAGWSDVQERMDAGADDPMISKVTRALVAQLPRDVQPQCDADEALGRALLLGWPDWLARRRAPGSSRGGSSGGRGVVLSERSAVRQAELFVCVGVEGGDQADAQVHIASGVRPEWLPSEAIEERVDVAWDSDGERVVGVWRRRLGALVLARQSAPVQAEAAAALLAHHAARDPAKALDLTQVDGLLQRLRCLALWRPQLELPTFDDLSEVIDELCVGRRSFAQLRRVPLEAALLRRLSWRQRQLLDAEAPERLAVPSGSHVRLRYRVGEAPVLAVRMQELFGLAQTPRLAGGRVAVRLELLAPNRRVQQITDDLAGFWDRTWPQVRKELRARYPKHAWPEDPLAARPLRGTKRR